MDTESEHSTHGPTSLGLSLLTALKMMYYDALVGIPVRVW